MTSEASTVQRDSKPAKKNFCFACGPDNPDGMHLKFSVDAEVPLVRGTFNLANRYQGPPGGVHGGIIASLVDEAMGKLNRVDGIVGLTAEINVEYLRLVPLGREILVEARPSDHHGRNYWRECTIRDSEGKLLVRSRGRFVKVAVREPASSE